MKLFHCPGSCSNGIEYLLQQTGHPFEVEIIDLKSGDHRQPEFLAQNSKGKVPALSRPDGSVLTEFPVISYWVANHFPEAKLLSQDPETRIRTLEVLEHIVSSIHMRGFTFIFAPHKFTTDEVAQETLRKHGRSEVEKGLAQLSETLGTSDYLMGDFSIADCAAFYVLTWAKAAEFTMPENLGKLLTRLQNRSA